MTIDFEKTFQVLRQEPVDVPLEVFHSDPYQALVSTVMSARTNDDTTLVAARKLFSTAPDIETLAKLQETEIAKLIFPVGFYKTKAKNLKKLAQKLMDDFEGQVPSTREELMDLPGVGRKTANLVLNRAFDKPAIAVDTHVHRITNMLGWVQTNSPEKTEIALMQLVPEKYWSEMNKLFVSLGRQKRSINKLEEFLKEHDLINSPK
jgi:endonuclease III